MPALNSSATVVSVGQQVRALGIHRIFLVDNGSTDGTVEKARKIQGITIVRNTGARGYGANMKSCFRLARKTNAQIIVELHPDGEYDADGIAHGIAAIARGADVVIGNRFGVPGRPKPRGMFVSKYVALRLLSLLQSLLLRCIVPDYQSGFRMFTGSVIDRVPWNLCSDGYLFRFELLCLCLFYRYVLISVPVTANYTGKNRGIYRIASYIYAVETIGVIFRYYAAMLGKRSGIFRR